MVAKANLDKDPKYKSIVDHRGKVQGRLAHQLHESGSVPFGSCGIPEVKKFQASLPDYQLNVISKEHLNALIYSGPEAEKHLYLYHHDNHYDVITRTKVVQNESGDEKVFSGPNTKDEFCEWMFQQENANTTFVAHNFQAYDGYFILQYLYKNGITPEIITRCAKILSLTVSEMNIKFIDSLCFIPMKLAAFPKTFGLTELQKGYFPHFFNRAENQDYVGPLPHANFYDPDGMSTDDHEKFYTWYNDLFERQYEFDFQAEILRYCQSDVDILRRCCLEFRELSHEVTDVDPFPSCLTIASACNLIFRKTFLQENTIAVIPPCGYKPENKQSVIALKMLAWIAQRDNIAIRHARNHGEQRIGKYLVDGFNVEMNTIWEIQGCLWHGCERCYARDTVNPINHMTMQDLKQRTLEKIQFLNDNGYNVVKIWTCDIERQHATEPEMKDFFHNFEISEPLEPRHAFFGGRTNATRLFFETQTGEKVRYVNFCSLYPWYVSC